MIPLHLALSIMRERLLIVACQSYPLLDSAMLAKQNNHSAGQSDSLMKWILDGNILRRHGMQTGLKAREYEKAFPLFVPVA